MTLGHCPGRQYRVRSWTPTLAGPVTVALGYRWNEACLTKLEQADSVWVDSLFLSMCCEMIELTLARSSSPCRSLRAVIYSVTNPCNSPYENGPTCG